MDTPPQEHPIWHDIVQGRRTFEFENLAVKILQGTLARSVVKDPSPANIRTCARALQELFANNADLPSIQNDLKKICMP